MRNRVLGTNMLATVATVLLIVGTVIGRQVPNADSTNPVKRFRWPNGRRAAVSLSFDDARVSQIDTGLALLKRQLVKVTFFVQAEQVRKRLDGWKKAVANGHEIGNHSLTHPCTGNFVWSRKNALEDYTLEQMRTQLKECNKRIQDLLNVKAEVFAYPCGQKYVGKGVNTKSY